MSVRIYKCRCEFINVGIYVFINVGANFYMSVRIYKCRCRFINVGADL